MEQRSSLAVVLEQLGISQGEVARRTGLARQTVTEAYHGRPVSPLTMVKIAKAIHVPLKTIDPLAAEELGGVVLH
jgi:transcriptional regulator with XRE-family HTH domain